MNSDFSKLSRDERDARITALILGELSPDETEQTRQTIAADAELAREYERRKQTIELVRETAAMDRKVSSDGTALKLDDERRQKLLERFKTPAPCAAEPRRPRNLWYVPMSLAAALVGLLVAAVTLPKLSKAKARMERGYALGAITRLSAIESAEGLNRWRVQDAGRLPVEAPAPAQPSSGSRTGARGIKVALPAAVAEDGRVQITGLTDLGAERMLVFEQLGEQPIDKSLRAGIKLEVDRKLERANESFAIAVGPSSEGLGVTKGIANQPTPPPGPPPVSAEPARAVDYLFAGGSDSTRATEEMATIWGETTNAFFNLTAPPSPGIASSYFFSELQNPLAASPPGGFPATAPVPGQAPPALGGSVFSADAVRYMNVKREPTANTSASPSKPSSDFVDLHVNGAIALGDKEVAATTRQKGRQNVALYDDDYDQAAVAAQIQRAGGVASGGFGGGGRGSFGNRLGGAAQVAAGRFDGIDRPQRSPANAATTRGFYDDNVSTASISDPTRAANDVDGHFAFQLSAPANEAQLNRESSPTRVGEERKAAAGPRNYAGEPLQGMDAAGLPVESKDAKAIRDATAPAEPRRAEAGTWALLPAIPAQPDGNIGRLVALDRIEDQTYQKNAVQPEAAPRVPSQTEPKLLKEQLAQIIETKKTDGPTVLSANSTTSPIRSVLPPTTAGELRAGSMRAGSMVTNAAGHLSEELTEAELQMPTKGTVQLIEEAEAESSASPTWWGRISGMLSGDVRRSARISVEQPMTDVDTMNRGYIPPPAPDANSTKTAAETIQSTAVLGKVIEKLKLDEAWARKQTGEGKLNSEEAFAKLKKMVDVKRAAGTTLIDIGVKSRDPEEAARIANTIAEVYRDSRDEERAKMATHGVAALKQELPKKDGQVARAKEELEQRRKELNGGKAETSLPKPPPGSPTPQPEVLTRDNAFSTFSLNVSDVSFKLAAASLEKGAMPEVASLRSEEFLNAFDYRDPAPAAGVPVAFAWERARYPFAHNRDALRFSVKTAAQGRESGKPLNIVLLLDNSGSMERADRVRIIQESLRSLAAQLKPQDKLSVVTFSRTATLRADGVAGAQAAEVAKQIGALTPEGGTNLEDALDLAYRTALRHYAAAAVNRVVLLTDGAANLGNVEPKTLKAKVEGFRKQGVALDCFGIGWDGFNDDLLEQLSRNGDGRYGFVNTPEEAATEFVGQLAGALRVAASDVKVQVEFNPKRVTAYRQIGYAKHQLTKQQFRDNTVDAAEIGAAEAGNGLYIIETNPRGEGPIATVRARFRIPQTSDYREHEWVVPFGSAVDLEQSSSSMRLATSASAFSEWLASSPFSGEVTTDRLLGLMSGVPEVFGADTRPKKLEWMIRQAKSISGK